MRREMVQFKVGDRVGLPGADCAGTVTSVNTRGNLGVEWDDGEITPEGSLHPLDIVALNTHE